MMTSIGSKKALDSKIQQVLDLKNSGKITDAIDFCKDLAEEFPAKASVIGLLASLYFLSEQYDKAIPNFKKASVINPNSERASLGLFHSLWESGDQENALNEMKRFLQTNKSKEYELLISEMGISD